MNRNSGILPVVAALIFKDRKQILLARRKKNLSQGLKWEFPGGKLKPEETPEFCLQREIKEELGLQIEVGGIFTAVNHQYPDKNILLTAYLAGYISGELSLTDHDRIQWVEPEKLLEYDLSPADIPVAEKLLNEFRKGRIFHGTD